MVDVTSPESSDTSPSPAARPSRRRRILIVGGVIATAALIFVFAYFEPHKAFIDDKVNETIPGLDAVLVAESTSPPTVVDAPATTPPSPGSTPVTDATSQTPATDPPGTAVPETAVPETAATVAPVSETTVPAGNSISASIARAAESGLPVVLSSGSFVSGEHTTTGTALVVALPDGSLVVRFEDLDTSNGPDLRVVLSTDAASDSFQYEGRKTLEELKGNIGDQNYSLGADVDLTQYRSVVIWCERFSVAFGAAAIDVQA